MGVAKDILDTVNAAHAEGEVIAVATLLRARDGAPGTKAVVTSDGVISGDWIGKGPARAALLRAARAGTARRIKLRSERGVTMDVFVEPMLPRPVLLVLGASPVAIALADLARRTGFFVTVCAPAVDHELFGEADQLVDGYAPPVSLGGEVYMVVARPDGRAAALPAEFVRRARYHAVIGPRSGRVASREKKGLDIGAITAEEIALSIVAEMVATRRRG